MSDQIIQAPSGTTSQFISRHERDFYQSFVDQAYVVPSGLSVSNSRPADFSSVIDILHELYDLPLDKNHLADRANDLLSTLNLHTETMQSFEEQLSSVSDYEKNKFRSYVESLIGQILDGKKSMQDTPCLKQGWRLAALFVRVRHEGLQYKISEGELSLGRSSRCSWGSLGQSSHDRVEQLKSDLAQDLTNALKSKKLYTIRPQCYDLQNTSTEYSVQANAGPDRDIFLGEGVTLVPHYSNTLNKEPMQVKWRFSPQGFQGMKIKWLDSNLEGAPSFQLTQIPKDNQDIVATLEVTDANGNTVTDDVVLHVKKFKKPTIAGQIFGPDWIDSGEKAHFVVRIAQSDLQDVSISWSMADRFSGVNLVSKKISETSHAVEFQAPLVDSGTTATLLCHVEAYDKEGHLYSLDLEKPFDIHKMDSQRKIDLEELAQNTGGRVIDTKHDDIYREDTFDVIFKKFNKEDSETQNLVDLRSRNTVLLFDISGSMSGNYRNGRVRSVLDTIMTQIVQEAVWADVNLSICYYGNHHVYFVAKHHFDPKKSAERQAVLSQLKGHDLNQVIAAPDLDLETLWEALRDVSSDANMLPDGHSNAVYAFTDYEIDSSENESGDGLNRSILERIMQEKNIVFNPVVF